MRCNIEAQIATRMKVWGCIAVEMLAKKKIFSKIEIGVG